MDYFSREDIEAVRAQARKAGMEDAAQIAYGEANDPSNSKPARAVARLIAQRVLRAANSRGKGL